jgi:hypothetical protein
VSNLTKYDKGYTLGDFSHSAFSHPEQGDQIGRILAYWAIDYSGQFFENN